VARGVIGTPPSAHRGRFRLAYVALAAVVAVAAASFAVLMNEGSTVRHDDGLAPNWSRWQPAGDDASKVNQIAAFVARHYRLGKTQPLAVIKGIIPPTIPVNGQLVPIVDFAVSTQTNGKVNYSILPADGGVIYQLCGLGRACAIEAGKASVERERLLRRESLELALYTLRYLPNVDSVITFLPPRAGQPPQWAFYFGRDQFAPELRHPLAATLPAKTPPSGKSMTAFEAQQIDLLTDPWRFHFHYTQLQDQSLVLALDPSGQSAQQ
jgi:hypothetical protein